MRNDAQWRWRQHQLWIQMEGDHPITSQIWEHTVAVGKGGDMRWIFEYQIRIWNGEDASKSLRGTQPTGATYQGGTQWTHEKGHAFATIVADSPNRLVWLQQGEIFLASYCVCTSLVLGVCTSLVLGGKVLSFGQWLGLALSKDYLSYIYWLS